MKIYYVERDINTITTNFQKYRIVITIDKNLYFQNVSDKSYKIDSN